MSHNIFDAERYATVESVKVPTDTVVKAEQAKVGDVYKARPVVEVKVGRKWVYVTVADEVGRTAHEFPMGAEISVVRNVETQESIVARRRAWESFDIAERVTKRAEATNAALAAVTEAVTTRGYADGRVLGGLMQAQAMLRVLDEFVGFSTHESNAHLADAAAARDAFIAEVLVPRLQRSTFRALSRSTSVMDNILEDVDREAIQRFIDSVRWGF